MPLPRLRGGDRRGWQRRRRCPRRRRRAARRGSSRRRRSRSACRGLRRLARKEPDDPRGRPMGESASACAVAGRGRGKNDARQRQSGRESTRFFRTVELLGVPSCSAEASCSPSGGSSAPPAWSVGRVEGPRGRSSSAAGSGRVACARRRLSTASEPPSRWRHRVKIVRWPPESFFRCSVRAGRFTSAHRERCVLRHTSRTFHVSASLRDQQHCVLELRRCPAWGPALPLRGGDARSWVRECQDELFPRTVAGKRAERRRSADLDRTWRPATRPARCAATAGEAGPRQAA